MSPADTAPTRPVGHSREAATFRTAPIALWRIAQAFLHTLHALFGAPERVAFLHALTARNHALMSSWLRAGEALMRRLLLIEAAAYPKPNTRPLLARAPRKRAPKLMHFYPETQKPGASASASSRRPAGVQPVNDTP